MSGLEFLQQLESKGVLDSKVVKAVRSKISRPGKTISANRVAKYLVEKGELTAAQAERFLNEAQPEPVEMMTLSEVDVVEDVEDVVDLTAVPEPLGAIQDLGVDQFEQTDALGDPGAGIEDAPPLTPEEEERERRRFEAKKVLENRWEAKWMIIGPTLVIVLAMTAAFLYFVLLRQDAEELLDIAEKSYRSQSYAEAIENYGKFLRSHPRHPEASKARVRQGLGKIRTFSDSNVYDKALLELPLVLPEIENEEAFPDEGRPELTSILPDIALGFVAKAERASAVKDKEAWVDKCEEAMEYVGNAMYLPTSARKQAQTKLDDLAARLETVNRDIQREKQLVAVIAAMDVAISQDKTTDAFILRKDLLREFPILEGEARLIEASERTAQHEQSLVKNELPELEVFENARLSDVMATAVFATRVGQEITELEGQLYPLLARGAVYMVNASSGEVLWRHFVGYETSNQPQWVNEAGGDIILSNQQSHEVVRVEGRTGAVVWRSEIGEPFGPVTLTKDSVFVSTYAGRVLQLALEADATNGIPGGTVMDGVLIPQPLNVGAASDRIGKHVYQVGLQSNVYVLTPGEGGEPMSCEEVFYLGHRDGSVKVTPILTQGLLFIVENSGTDFSNLHVLKPANRGLGLERAQAPIRLRGEVLAALELYGRRGLLTLTDQGEIKLWEVELVEEGEDPVKEIATFDRKTAPGTYSFYLAEKGKLWVGDSGLTDFEVQAQRGTLNRTNAYNAGDQFIAPFALFGDTLLHARVRAGSQLVSVAAVNAENHSEVWRTDLAAPMAGRPNVELDGSVLAVTSQGDQYVVDQAILEAGGASIPRRRGSTTEQDLVFDHKVDLGEGRILCFGPPKKRRVLGIDPTQKVNTTALSDSGVPAGTLSFPPVMMGNQVLAGSTQGPVFLLDAFRGRAVGTPFQPVVAPGKVIQWMRPAVIGDDRFVIAEAEGEIFAVKRQGNGLTKQGQVSVEGQFVSPLAAVGGQVMGVVSDGVSQSVMSFNPDNLAAAGETELPAAVTYGPVAAGEYGLIATADGSLHGLSGESDVKWSFPLNGTYPVGSTLEGDNAFVTLANGQVLEIKLSEGAIVTTLNIGEPLKGDPLIQGGILYASGADGTLYAVGLN